MPDEHAHDPLDQNFDENEIIMEEIEKINDTGEVEAAEESAMNTDTDIAQEATEATFISEDVLEEEAQLVEEALEKKGRESTSEKSKKAGEARKTKTASAEPVSQKKLDPLRLRGKKYREAVALVDKDKQYTAEEAVALAKKSSYSSFEGAIEAHFKVKTEGVRGMIVLPHGTGKSKKVAVADDETIEAIAAGKIDFDILLATPAQMPKIAKFAKVLGPKGLMPSPKAGTVTDDIEKVKSEIGGGRVEYRVDKTGVVHASIGRASFTDVQLVENFRVLEAVLLSSKILSISLSATMGPGVKVEISK